jgi:hypothetical protein
LITVTGAWAVRVRVEARSERQRRMGRINLNSEVERSSTSQGGVF